MTFRNTQTVPFALPIVWSTMRDHLPEIISKQEDIEYIKVGKRVKAWAYRRSDQHLESRSTTARIPQKFYQAAIC